MHILLVEPSYHTAYPPLGLLKIAASHKADGNTVEIVHGIKPVSATPQRIYITSLFTYAWKPVHQAVHYYRSLFPQAYILLGGIYASLMPEHARLSGADEIYTGLITDAERLLPDYSLMPEWKTSIMFSTRGCVRSCPFCAVPRLEKHLSTGISVKQLVYPGHKKIVLWDNNFLAVKTWRQILLELREIGMPVDFNQGLDARLIDDVVAQELSGLKLDPVRMAYDLAAERKALEKAIPALVRARFNKRRIIVYTLYNFTDTPDNFWSRVADLLEWGVVCYPMRYEPLNSLVKNQYVSLYWTKEDLEMVARARRVLGAGGAFPPYEGLRKKLVEAKNFYQAFELRPSQATKPQLVLV
jgi:hypothetical protein